MNKRLIQTLKKNEKGIKKSKQALFVDCYNKSVSKMQEQLQQELVLQIAAL